MILSGITLLFANGCVSTPPAISHAHIGHALTAWHDTPGNKGLMQVSESEAMNAWKELQLAKQAVNTPNVLKQHVENIVHSLNPELIESGTGFGYGVIPAIQGVIQHVKFSAGSKDASENVIHSSGILDDYANETVDKFLLALAQARLAARVTSSQRVEYLAELENTLLQAIVGVDIDRDGVIGNQAAESGLKQVRKLLTDMAANEVDPRYDPIEKHYLLGLVRLPAGGWVYRRRSVVY